MRWMRWALLPIKLCVLMNILIVSIICPFIPLLVLAYNNRGKLGYWITADGVGWPKEATSERVETREIKTYYQKEF